MLLVITASNIERKRVTRLLETLGRDS